MQINQLKHLGLCLLLWTTVKSAPLATAAQSQLPNLSIKAALLVLDRFSSIVSFCELICTIYFIVSTCLWIRSIYKQGGNGPDRPEPAKPLSIANPMLWGVLGLGLGIGAGVILGWLRATLAPRHKLEQ